MRTCNTMKGATTVSDPNQCSECGGVLIYGPPLHRCHVSDSGGTRDLFWCIECSEYISSASWDHESNGPYQFTVTCNAEGHA
jgi:hypothetical protein